MFDIHTGPLPRQSLYCSKTGTRLQPAVGLQPPVGTPVAVVVSDYGLSHPIFGDTLLGRQPAKDHRVMAGECASVSIIDPIKWVSRSHLLFRVLDWKVAAIDLGSVNGTEVETEPGNWQKLVPGVPLWVETGQSIRLGVHRFTVHHLGRL